MRRIISVLLSTAILLTVMTGMFTAFAEGETTAQYTVIIYQMDVTGDLYEAVDSYELTGVVGELVSVEPEEIEGFTYNSFVSHNSENVDPYGDTELRLYYDRNEWIFTVYAGNRIIDEFITFYNAPISAIQDVILDGYLFEGWVEEIPTVMPNSDFELHAILSPTAKVYCAITGLGSINYDESSTMNDAIAVKKLGTTISLVADEIVTDSFLYWVNEETNRIVSFDKAYSFIVGSYARLRANFYDPSDQDYHMVTYLNSANSILLSEEFEIGEEIIPPEPTPLYGYTFVGWSMDAETASITAGNVTVRATYTKDNLPYTLTITNTSGTSGAGTYNNGDTVHITTPTENFSYWRDSNGEIVSYYPNYTFIIHYDATFTAVYGATVPAVPATCRITAADKDFVNNKLTVHEEWSVDSAYTVVQTGILVTKSSSVGLDDELFIIGTSGVIKGTSTAHSLIGTYSLGLNGWTPAINLYTRPYVVVQKDNTVTTVYGRIHQHLAGA